MPAPSLVLSLNGNNLLATDSSGHSIRVPCDINGLRLLKELLKAKELNPGKIGTTATPTQGMVNEFLKSKEMEKENEKATQLSEISNMF